MHVLLLAEVYNRAQEIEQALVALERLEYVDQGLGGQLIVVLDGDLNAHLQILSYIRL